MITIIGLPILSLCYLNSIGAFIQYRTIELNMPREHEKEQVLAFKKTHQFKEFKFSNDDISNNETITQIDSQLQLLKKTNDTTNGIIIKLENQVKYNYFIQGLNLLFKHDYKTFLLEENEIWILWDVAITHNIEPKSYINCGTQDLIYRQHVHDFHTTILKEREERFLSNFKELWILGVAYIVFVSLSILSLWKQ